MEEMEENDTLVKVGIASARDRNLNYKSLLIDIGFADMNNIIFLIVYSKIS